MNKRRLLRLAGLLEADARKRKGISFNLGVVGFASDIQDTKTVKLDCGTSACAMGIAAMSGAFKSAGLSYRIRRGGFLNNISCTIDGKIRYYDTAAKKIFDLSYREAHFLFTPNSYPRGMDLRGGKAERFVAKRIRDFCAGKVHPDTAASP